MGNLEARRLDDSEHDEFTSVFGAAFLEDSEADLARLRPIVPHVTPLGVFDDAEMVGCGGHYSTYMSLPGARSCPVAGVTLVGVKPGHRRRGVLTALMRAQLDGLRDADVPLAALYASEGAIYGRFGYGMASFENHLSLPGRVAFRGDVEVDERPVREIDLDEALPAIYAQHARAAANRPGWIGRDSAWRARERMRQARAGRAPYRCALHDGGHAIYRVSPDWTERGPDYRMEVVSLVADDPASYAALCRHLLDFDLVSEVTWRKAAIDEPVVRMLVDPRAAAQRVVDGVWLRLVDVEAALTSRDYLADVDVVLEVRDAFCPWNEGRWRLRTRASAVERTSEPAQLALDVADLAAAYLGGSTLHQLAAAGRVRELEPGALTAASRALAGDRAPSCPDAF
ncbi:GNAT family N-acetyltransferase [Saccharopolyspora sp. TS4A08]|uniref:GNAT family N-acetyltransferase n=1 Tax=Saccharopolyspora ipomoeae TaxID=3042027 RepID=A0ABT6PSG9_9PSEU|nr:GNAT family N-acetyltransferase [Saccharopolyspora sp. TS4A08]MDI2030832.1 GNAT family N-acetyltransferase [Saccharopolyspora sp. TS4A08]